MATKKPASHNVIGTSPGHKVIMVNGVPTIVITSKPKAKSPPSSHSPAILQSHAVLQAFDSGTYLATVQLTRSPGTTLAGVPVSRSIASGLMTPGHTVALIVFDHLNVADSMIVGVS
jgi:hypothetical protein